MDKKLDSIDMGEKPAWLVTIVPALSLKLVEFLVLALLVKPGQPRHLVAIDLGWRVSQLFFECLLEDRDIAVFTEHKRHYQPIVSGSYLAVWAVEAQKRPSTPARNIGRNPGKSSRLCAYRRCAVASVLGCHSFAPANGHDGSSHRDAIHHHVIPARQACGGELMFGFDACRQRQCAAGECYFLSFL